MVLRKLLLIVVIALLQSCFTTYGYTLQKSGGPPAGTVIEDESFLQNPHYETNNELQDLLARMQKNHPNLVRVHAIGSSLEGRPLLAVEIRANADHPRPALVPMFKYVANMHGDETIGRELLVYLAQYLVNNYGRDPEITALVNSTDIFLMPTMNPDGFERSKEGYCESLPGYVGRYNAAQIDLNRDFPDRFDDDRKRMMRRNRQQPETVAVMNWILSNPFVLSANLHGGAVVASYPYDNSIYHHECCEDSPTPDNHFFKYAALVYAENHPVMRNGHDCNETFQNGITNGAYWYELNGGMQDFNYVFSNCFEITLELSCCKYPRASELPKEWHKNKRSLIEYIKLAHVGVKGLVTDTNGLPIKDADIIVDGINQNIRTTPLGEYWRLLVPGNYKIRVEAVGYYPSNEVPITITAEQTLLVNFSLKSYDIDEVSDKTKHPRVVRQQPDQYGFLIPPKFEHHNYTAMTSFIHDLNGQYPSITKLYSIGKTVQQRDLWVMEITRDPGRHIAGKPEVKYIANMHGNEVVGREMLLLYAKYLCENYNRNGSERVSKLVNNTRLHLLFSMNPDGYEISEIEDKDNLKGRANANNVDLNRNFPDQFGRNKYNEKQEVETLAVMNWSQSIPFVLSANLHGGALVANYPYDDSPKDFAYMNDNPRTVYNPTEENEMFKYLAHTYSDAHTTMHFGKPCPSYLKESFKDGITNGAAWYSVTGGMQDWSYIVGGAYELTLEVGCTKFPKADELPSFWLQNREALLRYVEQAQHGITGMVQSTIGHAIPHATIQVNNIQHVTYTTKNGDYYRMLLPGLYNITAEADGYEPHTTEVLIPPEATKAVVVDFQLMRDDPQHWSSAYDYRTLENVVRTRYHTDVEIRKNMGEFENKHYKTASVEFGDNEVSMMYPSVKITHEIGNPEETKLHVLVLSSLFQSTMIGRELVMNLARHVLAGYQIPEPEILKLLQNVVLHFVPIKIDSELLLEQFQSNRSVCDPTVKEELADKLLSAETDKQKDMLLRMLQEEEYDLALNFAAGGNDVFYPNTDDKVAIYPRFAEKIKGHKYTVISNEQCPSTASRLNQADAIQRVTNQLHSLYKVPLFTLQVGCCKMPPEAEIATVWRQNLERMTNFLHLIDTGIKGYVRDVNGNPLRKAILKVRGNNLIYKVTPNLAHFRVVLPSGPMEIEFSCMNYTSRIQAVTLNQNQILDMGDIIMQEVGLPVGRGTVEPLHPTPQRLGQVPTGKPEHHDSFAVMEPMDRMKIFPQDGGVEMQGRISGLVLDEANHPLPNSKVYIENKLVNLTTYTDPIGKFQLSGVNQKDLVLHVEASGYSSDERTVHIGPLNDLSGVIFHLKRDERVLGIPRLLFVILAGCASVAIIACGIMCFMFIQKRRHNSRYYYSFSMLPQKGEEQTKRLFDDDDDGETELFRAPVKKLQPYYDDDRDPVTDSDDDSEEEIVMLNSSFRS
ncbi:carboxypeptidase D-like [Uranotaenia lowii]|uniref:carboxypeptidase D-like n=1 Tax=Uranotaenia lowii TaxID=190385 RepID=UPI002479DB7D|nr:carboxypeptidase D-like [Uranotaenia lowii]